MLEIWQYYCPLIRQVKQEVGILKKLLILAAMLALVLALAAPAIAQVANGVGNESESGDVSPSLSTLSSGNSSDQCVNPIQFGNTGNFQNGQAFLQYNSTADDLSGSGGSFTFAPVLTAPCTQQVQQSSAASSK
jgi:opacity protein-like surface antigen